MPAPRPFLQTLHDLLRTGHLTLHGRLPAVPVEELVAGLELLREAYEREAAGYPGTPPEYDLAAAAWSAKTLFHAAQLLLYRTHDAAALTDLFPPFEHARTPGAILTADLCLRYLPSLLRQLELLDVEDELIPVLRRILTRWHYSGLLLYAPFPDADLTPILADDCLARCYVDRVIATQNMDMGARPELQGNLRGAMGNHASAYWPELNRTP